MRDENCPDPLANPFDQAVPGEPRRRSRLRRALAMVVTTAAVAAGVTGGIALAAEGDPRYTYTYQLVADGETLAEADLTGDDCAVALESGIASGHLNGACTEQEQVEVKQSWFLHTPEGTSGPYLEPECIALAESAPAGSYCSQDPRPVPPTPDPEPEGPFYLHADGTVTEYPTLADCQAALDALGITGFCSNVAEFDGSITPPLCENLDDCTEDGGSGELLPCDVVNDPVPGVNCTPVGDGGSGELLPCDAVIDPVPGVNCTPVDDDDFEASEGSGSGDGLADADAVTTMLIDFFGAQ